MLNYKSQIDTLSDIHEEKSVAKDLTKSSADLSKRHSGSAKKLNQGLVRVDSTGGRANKGTISLAVSVSGLDQPSASKSHAAGESTSQHKQSLPQADKKPVSKAKMNQTPLKGRTSSRSVGTRDNISSAVVKTEVSELKKDQLRISESLTKIKQSNFKDTLFSARPSSARVATEASKQPSVEPLFSKPKPSVVSAAPKARIDTGLNTPRNRPSSVAASRLKMMSQVTKVVERSQQTQSVKKTSPEGGSTVPSEQPSNRGLSHKLKSLRTTQFTPLFK